MEKIIWDPSCHLFARISPKLFDLSTFITKEPIFIIYCGFLDIRKDGNVTDVNAFLHKERINIDLYFVSKNVIFLFLILY